MIHTKRIFFICTLSLFISGILLAQTGNGGRYAANSVLASGNWFKIKVGSTGIYKLTYSDLRNMGVSEPKNVQIYGYGGEMLDEDFTKPYIDDLPQVAVWMSKPRAEFGEGDYILFYAKGDIKWTYNPVKEEFTHTQNPYSTDSYYFVTESADGPLLMNQVTAIVSPMLSVSAYTDYYLHEKELINLLKSGREYYGESFQTARSQDFALNLQGVEPQGASLRVSFIAKLPSNTTESYLTAKYNGVSSKKLKLPYSSSSVADELNDTVMINNLSETGTLTLGATGTISSNIYLNYFKLEYQRKLKPYDAVTLFRSKIQSSQLGFVISDATDKMLVFDVSNASQPRQIMANLSGTELRFTAPNIEVKEYALVDTESSNIPVPQFAGQVENQNLHSLSPQNMVIIVREFLKPYAEQLAQIHRENSDLASIVVTAEDIYNEFSSGKPDITAYRRFLKMFYDRDASTAPQYLLLFGDGAYDNRFIENIWHDSYKTAMLLTYQSAVSLVEDASLVTDDYIGFLDDNEVSGTTDLSASVLDIGIGRLPVRTQKDAHNAVTKIKNYLENNDKGIWRNNIAF
ncbi:MAG: C25 family cysteine peptidase, partial [Prevotella sp.]|nr:C25 family cysteine peptidase [Prevotella sp.]